MNPNAGKKYIEKPLFNIWFDETVKKGDKINVYRFDDESHVIFVDFAYLISKDYNLDETEVLLRYFPDIETRMKTTYTFIRADKCRGDRWAVLLTEDGEERHINLSETENTYYCNF